MKMQRSRLIAMTVIPLLIGALVIMYPAGATTINGAAAGQGSTTTLRQLAAPIDWTLVDQAMGRAGAMQPGNVQRYAFPRSDLQVTVRGTVVKAPFALGTHIEMLPVGDGSVMYMGDIVLTEDEVSPVLSALQQSGVDLAALHNHLLGEAPRVMYLHIGGHGDPVQIATTIHTALGQSKTPMTAAPSTAPAPDTGLDTKQLDQLLGYAGKANGGVYQFSVPRAEKIMDSGMAGTNMPGMDPMGIELPPAIGVATAINFQATGDGKALITGDFVLLGNEIASVSRILQGSGIDVTAVHSHSSTGSPRLFYLHFFANDDPAKLASSLRAALNQTNSAPAAQ